MSIALIAGTGIRIGAEEERWVEVATPYGPACLASTSLGNRDVMLLRRHGPGLNIPPHLINYRANIWALRNAGASHVLATAAVGSLRDSIPPGTLAVVDDFIDFTKRRESTYFDRPAESVTHIDYSVPYCPEISSAFDSAALELGMGILPRITYVCTDGPRYETPAEVRMLALWGGDVVGMTGVPEVVLAREMGLCYGALAIVTNFAAGFLDKPVAHEDVVQSVREQGERVSDIIARAATLVSEDHRCCTGGQMD